MLERYSVRVVRYDGTPSNARILKDCDFDWKTGLLTGAGGPLLHQDLGWKLDCFYLEECGKQGPRVSILAPTR